MNSMYHLQQSFMDPELFHCVTHHRICHSRLRQLVTSGLDLDALDELGNNALTHAVRQVDLEAVKILVEAGASVNIPHGFSVN